MTTVPMYDAERLTELLGIMAEADAVELKLTVPHADHRRVLDELEIDSLDAQIRQVAFVDTPDLRLSEAGLVVRARRTQGKAGDLTVKMRPMLPSEAPQTLRALEGFKVEIDASPTGYTCSCSLTGEVSDRKVKALLRDVSGLRKLLTKQQRSLLDDRLPSGVTTDDLRVLGPLTLLKAKFAPQGHPRKLVAELWFLPDGARLLELSTKSAPEAAFQAAAEVKVFLAGHGIDLGAPQETKTRTALAALSRRIDAEQG